MIETVTDYAESTALERYVLDRLRPVLSSSGGGDIDLRGWQEDGDPVIVGAVGRASSSERWKAELRSAVMPLLFGAAWKVIDLLLELAMYRAAVKQDKKGGWTIAAKVKTAAAGAGDRTILTTDAAVWNALCGLYAATAEHRHCLVHRTASFSEKTGDLTGRNSLGNDLRPLSESELDAFVVAAQVACSAVVAAGLQKRAADHLRYELDRLRGHTGSTSLGGVPAAEPVTVYARLRASNAGAFEADFGALLTRARKSVSDGHFDFWFEVPDGTGRRLFAAGEQLPTERVVVDLENLPAYLQFR